MVDPKSREATAPESKQPSSGVLRLTSDTKLGKPKLGKYPDKRPLLPETGESTRKQKTSVRLDPLSLRQLQIIGLASGKTQSQLIQEAVSRFAREETEKKILAEVQAQSKIEAQTKQTKGDDIERAFMKRLLFSDSNLTGWQSV